jgi:hypothetical protein
MHRAYLVGVHCALAKLGTSAKGNPRITSQEELGEYIRNAYTPNPVDQPPPAGLGTRPETDHTMAKNSLYTQWSKEEPKLRNIGTEDQGAGMLGASEPHTAVEPASTASPSQPQHPRLLGQLSSGIDAAGGTRHKIG